MIKILYVAILFLVLNLYSAIPKNETVTPSTLKLNFDFFVKIDDGTYNKEYSGNAVVDNHEEVVFLYNNRIASKKLGMGNGIKISIKPFLTRKSSHFLVKYYKKKKNKFFLISKSLVKINPKEDSKIQIVDGEKIYKLHINTQNLY